MLDLRLNKFSTGIMVITFPLILILVFKSRMNTDVKSEICKERMEMNVQPQFHLII